MARGYEVIDIPHTERFEIETPFGGTVNPVLSINGGGIYCGSKKIPNLSQLRTG